MFRFLVTAIKLNALEAGKRCTLGSFVVSLFLSFFWFPRNPAGTMCKNVVSRDSHHNCATCVAYIKLKQEFMRFAMNLKQPMVA